jgi:pre-mRNA-processing factor 40
LANENPNGGKSKDSSDIFKEALTEMGVGSLWKWEDAKRVVEDDPRSRALRSMAERKNAFNDYIKELRNKEKVDMKERKVR